MYRKSISGGVKHLDFVLLDLICVHLGLILAYSLYNRGFVLPYSDPNYAIISLIMTLIDFAVIVVSRMFSGVLERGWLKEAGITFRHMLISLTILTFCMFALQTGGVYSRITLILAYLIYGMLSYLVRAGYKVLLLNSLCNSVTMLVITKKASAQGVLQRLKGDQFTEKLIRIVGICITDCACLGETIDGIPVVASSREVIRFAMKNWVDRVFISLPLNDAHLQIYIRDFEEMGMTVHLDMENINSLYSGKCIYEDIGTGKVMTTVINCATDGQMIVKRVADIIGSIVGLILMGIVSAFVIPLQQRSSPGPVFYRQERIGMNGRHFFMYKFRSMCVNAESKRASLMTENRVKDGMMFKLDWDPRIIGNRVLKDGTRKTGIGDFIRRTSIDELPQFINVLKGEMSMVGTRPPTLDEWERYDLHHRTRMAIRPGITGLWQVSGRSDITDFEEVVRLDTEYIKNWSIGLDIKILYKTVGVVFRHKGAL